jgi:uncharacterized SAM-binding protein YcdF (DUF218 family)
MKRRLWLKIFGGLTFLFILLALGAWFFPQKVLTVDSGPVKADALVVLGGISDRAERAAELFKQGESPKIIVSGKGDCVSNEKLLEKDGVTNAAIILECKSRTTRENAEFSIPLLRQIGAHRVIIVTSWYHSRRALACFEHYAPDIKFYSRPSYFGYVGKQQDRGSAPHPTLSPVEAERVRAAQRAERKAQNGYVKSEYLKLLGYWVCYGVCPL